MEIIKKHNDNRLQTHFFTDVHSFIDWTLPEHTSDGARRCYAGEFNGSGDSAEEIKEMINGFKTVENFERDTKSMVAPIVNQALTKLVKQECLNVEYAEAGFLCDPTLAMLDEQDCMINYEPQQNDKPIIWFAVPVSAAIHCEQAMFSRRAKAIIMIIEAYQSIGIDAGIVAFDGTQSGNKTNFQVVQVKAPDEYINQNTLTNILSLKGVTTSIALSRGLHHLRADGGHDVNLSHEIFAQATNTIDPEALLIISSSEARKLASNATNASAAAQHLLDQSSDMLAKLIEKRRGAR